jgi:hypothetical protein
VHSCVAPRAGHVPVTCRSRAGHGACDVGGGSPGPGLMMPLIRVTGLLAVRAARACRAPWPGGPGPAEGLEQWARVRSTVALTEARGSACFDCTARTLRAVRSGAGAEPGLRTCTVHPWCWRDRAAHWCCRDRRPGGSPRLSNPRGGHHPPLGSRLG